MLCLHIAATGLVCVAAAPVPAKVFVPIDLAFESAAEPANPFTARFEGRCVGPGGEVLALPGFYDGDGAYRLRFAPTRVGEWTVTTASENASLGGRVVRVNADANPASRGRLRIDPGNPRRFAFEDGTPFFLTGYECDWLWALDLGGPPGLPTAGPFLDKLAASGFNYVVMNAYAHDTDWRPGKTEDADYGPPPLFAWEGTNDAPDHSRMNLAYWRHYDQIVEAMRARGVQAHIMIKVYNKHVNWPERGSPEERLYLTWLVARYSAFPNIVWDFSKESYNEKDLQYKLDTLRFIRETDPYHHLMTVHDDDGPYDSGAYDDLLDFQSDQQHDDWHETILRQSARRAWPVLNIEFGYEWGPGGEGDVTYGVGQSPEEVLDRAWRICMAGGYPNYYYTRTAWDVMHPEDTPPGYTMMGHLRAFFEAAGFEELEPADELVSSGCCLAVRGHRYVAYQSTTQPFELTADAEGRLSVRWYRCLTGTWQDGVPAEPGKLALVPPVGWTGPVAVLAQQETR